MVIKYSFGLFALVLLFQNMNNAMAQAEIKIGDQIWTSSNLNVDKFRNGDPIQEAKTEAEWAAADKARQPAWCYYKNDASNATQYGKLYNWYAVNDPRGLAPEGFHIPTDAEWNQLLNYLGGEVIAGKTMKAKTGWSAKGNGTNQSGFNGCAGNYRFASGEFFTGELQGWWWSSTITNYDVSAWSCAIFDSGNEVLVTFFNTLGDGMSVRCVKD